MRAYLKDTADLLRLLDEVKLNPASMTYLVTMDICSLYTIIQHEDALLTLNWAFSRCEDIPYMHKCFLGKVLDLCMAHNYFWFHDQFFSQQVGVTMGAKFAPSLRQPIHGGMGG